MWVNSELWQLWCYCLLRANHKDKWVNIKTGRGETQVLVKAGQFLFGRKSAGKALKQNPISVYRRLKKLSAMGNLNLKPSTHYTIVSICNWDTYQNSDIANEQASEQPTNNQVTTNEQPTNTNKNVKNANNEKNDKKRHIFTPPTIEELKSQIGEKDYQVDAEIFHSFYASKGWMVGRNKMKDWRAALAQANHKGWAVKAPAQRTAMDVLADMEKEGR